jgi:[ribosomal protein S18]-alanine N-acetyltransferase
MAGFKWSDDPVDRAVNLCDDQVMSQSCFSLRPVTNDDLPEICRIEREVHLAPWSETSLKAEIEKPYSHLLVMTDDETDSHIAGYVVFWIMLEECQILNVAVGLPYRRRGLAKQMVRQVVSLAVKKGIKKVVLDVRKSNHAALQLYQGIGFAVVHISKAFYSDGEDAYRMLLSLEDDGLQF